jgi:NAD(P)-dependent dehydrogenase (short-subunit alcohol dehydrogenase family)
MITEELLTLLLLQEKKGNPNASAYSTSKAGVIGLTKVIR